ncbi:MAG: nicotinate mononucleotide-dependent phosphoribosyltransferase CobT [Thermoproteus sp.]
MNPLIVVVVGTTDISLIPGITIAGASPELTHYTPAADVEYLLTGRPKSIPGIPVTPDGIPTPAVVTRALTRDIPRLVAFAGGRVRPKVPYIDLGGEPGGDFRKRPALSETAVENILENGRILGRELAKAGDVFIGESIPGGTTTAMAILVALGYDAWGKTSSAGPDNPKDLKTAVVKEGFTRAGRLDDSIKALAELGDPVHVGVAAIALGVLDAGGAPVLAGGTQMLAAAAIIKALGGDLAKVTVATTGWIADDRSADFFGLARAVGVANIKVTRASFSASRFPGLRYYDRGYVKEGVAMGGALYLASLRGLPVLEMVEREYERLVGS